MRYQSLSKETPEGLNAVLDITNAESLENLKRVEADKLFKMSRELTAMLIDQQGYDTLQKIKAAGHRFGDKFKHIPDSIPGVEQVDFYDYVLSGVDGIWVVLKMNTPAMFKHEKRVDSWPNKKFTKL